MAIIFGTSENNNLRGTNVADEISLADGPGSAWSRDGNDNVWATTNGRHTVGTGAGNDTADLTGEGFKTAYLGMGNDEGWLNVGVAYLGGGNDTLNFVNKAGTTSSGFTGKGADSVFGSDGNQIVGCGTEGTKTVDLKGGADILYTGGADVKAWLGNDNDKDTVYIGKEGNKEISQFMVNDDTIVFQEKADNIKIFDNAKGVDVVELTMEFGNKVTIFADDVSEIAADLGIDLNADGFGEGTNFNVTQLNNAFTPDFF